MALSPRTDGVVAARTEDPRVHVETSRIGRRVLRETALGASLGVPTQRARPSGARCAGH